MEPLRCAGGLQSNSRWGGAPRSSVDAAARSIARRCPRLGDTVCRHDLIMRRNRNDGDTAPLTLGQALTAQVRLIVWCKACGHRAEPDVAEQVAHHGSGMTAIDWAARLRCQDCGERSADFVISGASL